MNRAIKTILTALLSCERSFHLEGASFNGIVDCQNEPSIVAERNRE